MRSRWRVNPYVCQTTAAIELGQNQPLFRLQIFAFGLRSEEGSAIPGSRTLTRVSAEYVAAIAADLGRFNEVTPGFGDRVVRFVVEGRDASIIAAIEALGDAARSPFLNQQQFPLDAHLGIRRRSLIYTQEWRPAVLHRFALVLDAVCEASGCGSWRSRPMPDR
jgi:hypothetical protein